MLARVPVPWGKEPKAQLFPERKNKSFVLLQKEPQHRQFLSRPTVAKIPTRSRISDPIVISQFVEPHRRRHKFILDIEHEDVSRPPQLRDLPKILPTKIEAVAAPVPSLPHLRKTSWRKLAPALAKWAVAKGLVKAEAPPQVRTQMLVRPTTRARGTEKLLPPSLLDWAVDKGIKRQSEPPLKPLDPFSTKTAVVSVERRRQLMTALLNSGEWCYIWEVNEIFPTRVRRWLLEHNVTLIRCFGRRRLERAGGGSVVGVVTPADAYVTEDGATFYVAEDGATFYVPEGATPDNAYAVEDGVTLVVAEDGSTFYVQET